MRILILFCLLLFPTAMLANGEKAPPLVISFHLQGSKEEGRKMVFPSKTIKGELYFRQSSEFKTADIVAQRPFPSHHDPAQYGMAFLFKDSAKKRLRTLTSLHKGKYLLVMINGKSIDLLRIDKPVEDGVICVWRGLLAADVHKADQLVPRIGEDAKEWKKRKKAAR